MQAPTEQEAYFKNMTLSQGRTLKTLEYVLGLLPIDDQMRWLRRHITANGLANSKIILNANGSENATKSQRVEFRVRTDSEDRIEKIIETAQ